MNFCCEEGRVRLSPELRKGKPRAAVVLGLGRGSQIQQRADARTLLLGRFGFGKEELQPESEPRVGVSGEGKRRLSHVGLESIMQCKLSADAHLL